MRTGAVTRCAGSSRSCGPIAAASLGALAGVLGKVAGDVVLLAQDEVGEVREGGDADNGNPVAAVSVIAAIRSRVAR